MNLISSPTGHGNRRCSLFGELDGPAAPTGKIASFCRCHVVAAANRPVRPRQLDWLLYLGLAKTSEHCLEVFIAHTRKLRFLKGFDAATEIKRVVDSFSPLLSGADLFAVVSEEEETCSVNSEKGAS
jgi:hypothetical protein